MNILYSLESDLTTRAYSLWSETYTGPGKWNVVATEASSDTFTSSGSKVLEANGNIFSVGYPSTISLIITVIGTPSGST